MLKRTLRLTVIYTLEVVAVVFTLAIFAGALLLWRLAEGPMSLDFARGYAQERLVQAFDGDLVSLGDLTVRFDPDAALIVVTARDVSVAETGGDVVTRAPLIEAGLALDALLIGRLAPVEVMVVGGSVSLVRRADGAVGAGLGVPERVARNARLPDSRRDSDAILELLRDSRRSDLLGRLRRVQIENTRVRVEDRLYGLSWLIDDAGLEIERADGRFIVDLTGNFVTTSGLSPVDLRLEAGADLDSLLLEAEASNIRLRALAPATGPFAALGALDAPVRIDLALSADQREGIRAADLVMDIGEGSFRFDAGEQPFEDARLDVEYLPETGEIALRAGSVRSGVLAAQFQGRIHEMRAFESALPQRFRYELTVIDGVADLGETFEGPLEWSRLHTSGQVDLDALSITFEELEADIGTLAARLQGAGALRQVEDGRWLPDLRLAGPINGNIGVRDVLAWWPVNLADGARVWVDEHVNGGRGFGAAFELDMAAEAIVDGVLPDDAMRLSWNFDGASFHYLTTMTPVEEASGRAVLFGNSMQITLDRGRVGDIAIRDGFVDIPRLNPKGAVARFGAIAAASAEDILNLIDQEPLTIPSDYGLDPSSISGEGEISVEIHRAMLSEVPVEDIRFAVEARFAGVSAPTGFGDIRVTDGEITLTADESRLTASGPVRFGPAPGHLTWEEDFTLEEDEASTRFRLEANLDSAALDELGVPLRRYVDGNVRVIADTLGEALEFERISLSADLTEAAIEAPGGVWEKLIGAPATAEMQYADGPSGERLFESIRASAEGFEISGRAELAEDGRLLGAQFDRIFVDGFIDGQLGVTRDGGPEGRLAIAVSGAFLDARSFLPNIGDMGGAGAPPPPLLLGVDFDRVRATSDTEYQDVTVDWRSSAAGAQRLDVGGEGPGGGFSLQMESASADQPRDIRIESPDFGHVLRLFGLYENVTGGEMRLSGSLPPAGVEGRTALRIESDDFTLDRMPVLARILAAGSFEGLGALLNNEGIGFETLRADIAFEDGLLLIDEARAAGPSLGVTTQGSVDMEGETIALDGVLAPSYGLNSLFGGLPLIGEMLVSRPGEGVIGITFSVEGPFEGPTVFANPLSALAPGVLRRIFEGTAAERAARVRAEDLANTPVEPVEPDTRPDLELEPEPDAEPEIEPDSESESEEVMEPETDAETPQ